MAEKISDYPAPRSTKILAPFTYQERINPDAFSYPGIRPKSAFLTSGDLVLNMHVHMANSGLEISVSDENGEQRELNSYLEAHEVSTLAERVSIVGFGSNANPSQLIKKFTEAKNPGDKTIVPTLKGKIKDVAPGYVPRVSILGGYVPADLVYAPGSVTDVAINLLSPEQYELMNKSEGSSYRLCKYGTVSIDGTNLSLPAYIYIAEEGSLVNRQSKPILVKGITKDAGLGEMMNQKEVLEFLAREIGPEVSKYDPEFESKFFDGDEAEQLKWFFKQNAPAGMHTAEQIVSNVLYGWIQKREINRSRGFKRRYAARNAINEMLRRQGLCSDEWSLLRRIDEKDILDKNGTGPEKLGELLIEK